MKLLHLYLFLLISFAELSGQQASYTKNDIEQDLLFLTQKLQKHHPSVYLLKDPAALEKHKDSLLLQDSYSDHEAYTAISSFATVIKDGHTLFYPSKITQKNNNTTGKYFPLKILWDGDIAMVSDNYDHQDVGLGHQIISINDTEITELIPFMIDHMMQDGNNEQYPRWVLNQFFFEYYSYLFGCQDQYKIIHSFDDDIFVSTIDGISKAEWIQNLSDTKETSKAIYYSFDLSNQLGYLTIKDWHNKVLKKKYRQSFKKEIDACFEEINQKDIDKLIIDLRDNQGGDLANSTHLLSYLLDAPYQVVKEYNALKGGKLKPTNGPQKGIHQAIDKPFDGELYILINGGSFSNTSIFCAALESSYRATFIGEETGGSQFVLCGSPKRITLPKTKIIVDIPKLQFVLQAYSDITNLHGIEPHYTFKPTIHGMSEGKDEMMDFVLRELIVYPKK